jgi:hypothetical protein
VNGAQLVHHITTCATIPVLSASNAFVIAGKQRATKMVLLIAIVIAVLAGLAILALSRQRSPQLPDPPLHSQAAAHSVGLFC